MKYSVLDDMTYYSQHLEELDKLERVATMLEGIQSYNEMMIEVWYETNCGLYSPIHSSVLIQFHINNL